jgi:hypothetical protein
VQYELATDRCRHSLLGTRDNPRQWQRVKPDSETNPLADLDCEKVPTAAARGRRFPSPRGGVALASHQRTNRVSGSPLPKGMLPSALCLATHCRYSAF